MIEHITYADTKELNKITPSEIKAYVVKNCGIGFSFRMRRDPRQMRPSKNALNKRYTIVAFYPGYVQCRTEFDDIIHDSVSFLDSFDYYDIYRVIKPEEEEDDGNDDNSDL